MTKFKPTIQEMQTWNKRYKLGQDTTRIIDTFDKGEYWTIHPNEAYNLCITLNKQHENIQRLQITLEDEKEYKNKHKKESKNYLEMYQQIKKEKNTLITTIENLIIENDKLKTEINKQKIENLRLKEMKKYDWKNKAQQKTQKTTNKRYTTNGYYIYDTYHDGTKYLLNQVEAQEIVNTMNNLDTKAREKSKALSKTEKQKQKIQEKYDNLIKNISDEKIKRTQKK